MLESDPEVRQDLQQKYPEIKYNKPAVLIPLLISVDELVIICFWTRARRRDMLSFHYVQYVTVSRWVKEKGGWVQVLKYVDPSAS